MLSSNDGPTSRDKILCNTPGDRNPFPIDKLSYVECDDQGRVKSFNNCPARNIYDLASKSCQEDNTKPDCPKCMNGGKCSDQQSACECAPGFAGDRCQYLSTCKSCGSDAVCFQYGIGAAIPHVCICDANHSLGLNCKDTQTNPCQDESSRGKTFAFNFNKNVYFKCDDSRPVLSFCPPPLVYLNDTFKCGIEI